MRLLRRVWRYQRGNQNPLRLLRRVWRYQRSYQNPYIEEEQTTQWLKEKAQRDKQRSTNHTYKTKDRVTRTPLKTGGELRCSGRVSSSCSTSDSRRVNLPPYILMDISIPNDNDCSHCCSSEYQVGKLYKHALRYSTSLNCL